MGWRDEVHTAPPPSAAPVPSTSSSWRDQVHAEPPPAPKTTSSWRDQVHNEEPSNYQERPRPVPKTTSSWRDQVHNYDPPAPAVVTPVTTSSWRDQVHTEPPPAPKTSSSWRDQVHNEQPSVNTAAPTTGKRSWRDEIYDEPMSAAPTANTVDEQKHPVYSNSKEVETGGWGERVGKSAMWGVIACGTGLFSDGYLNASIGPASTILGRIYGSRYKDNKNVLNVSAIAFAGTVVGQLFFGFTSDHWSRTGSLMASTVILIVFAILSAGAYGQSLDTMLAVLVAFRFFVGIGIGGEYPAGSVGAAEHSGGLKEGSRNRWFIMFTNVQIDLGWVLAYLVSMVVVLATTENHLRAAWRIILAIGAFPPIILFFLRLKLKEPEPFTHEKMTVKQTPWGLVIRYYWWRLTLVSLIWFIYDFCAYSFGNFSSTLVDNLFLQGGGDKVLVNGKAEQALWLVFGWTTLTNFFYLPGAMIGAILADKIGPKVTLITGTALQSLVGFALAAGMKWFYEPERVGAFCIVFGLFLAFGEMGPGDNIGLFASKTSPTAIRGKYYGVAAAVGKLGAFVGQYIFKRVGALAGKPSDTDPSIARRSVQYQFFLGGGLALFSCLLALFLPSITQDVVAEEDIRFRQYLVSHGYDTSVMGIEGHKLPADHPTNETEKLGFPAKKSWRDDVHDSPAAATTTATTGKRNWRDEMYADEPAAATVAPKTTSSWRDQVHNDDVAVAPTHQTSSRPPIPKTTSSWRDQVHNDDVAVAPTYQAESRPPIPKTTSSWRDAVHNDDVSSSAPVHQASRPPIPKTTSSWRNQVHEDEPTSVYSTPATTPAAYAPKTSTSWRDAVHQQPLPEAPKPKTSTSWRDQVHNN